MTSADHGVAHCTNSMFLRFNQQRQFRWDMELLGYKESKLFQADILFTWGPVKLPWQVWDVIESVDRISEWWDLDKVVALAVYAS